MENENDGILKKYLPYAFWGFWSACVVGAITVAGIGLYQYRLNYQKVEAGEKARNIWVDRQMHPEKYIRGLTSEAGDETIKPDSKDAGENKKKENLDMLVK